MSKENVLKKEFNKREVERMRNLLSNKSDSKTISGIGYTKVSKCHE